MSPLRIACVSFLVLAGCSDASMSPDAGLPSPILGADAGVPQSFRLRGVYFVPTDEGARTEIATYAIEDAEWSVDGQRVRLDYDLPRLLVGGDARVRLEGVMRADGTASLSGEAGTGECAIGGNALLTCSEQLPGVEVDLDRVRDEAARVDPQRADARSAVAVRFSTEPIGVFEATELLGLEDDEDDDSHGRH